MNKTHKIKIAISAFIILLPAIFSILGVSVFENEITAVLKTNSWQSAAYMFMAMPFILFAIYLIAITITVKENKNRQSEKIMNLIFFILPTISIFAFVFTVCIILGMDNSITIIMGCFLGACLALIGNYLPKCTRNKFIGIRLKWTLLNEENWAATHRFSGKLWFACGIFMIIISFLPEKLFLPLVVASTFLMVFVSSLYSYLYYKKQKSTGEWKTDETALKFNKKANIVIVPIVLIIISFCIFILFTGEIKISTDNSIISVEASYWSDAEFSISDIEKIELRESVDGSRVSGVGSPTLLVGFFKNDEFRSYQRYTYTKTKECIVLNVRGEIFVINLESKEATEKLYSEINSLMTAFQ